MLVYIDLTEGIEINGKMQIQIPMLVTDFYACPWAILYLHIGNLVKKYKFQCPISFLFSPLLKRKHSISFFSLPRLIKLIGLPHRMPTTGDS